LGEERAGGWSVQLLLLLLLLLKGEDLLLVQLFTGKNFL
jgi:hypothetical protein